MIERNEGKVQLTWSNKARCIVTLDAPDERGLLYLFLTETDIERTKGSWAAIKQAGAG